MDKRVDSESVRFLAVVALWFEPCSGHMGKPSSAYGLLEFSPGSPVFAHLWWTIGLIKVRYSLRAVKHKIKKKKKENKVTSCNKGHDYGCQCSANIRKMFVWFLFVVFLYFFAHSDCVSYSVWVAFISTPEQKLRANYCDHRLSVIVRHPSFVVNI